MRWRRLGWVLGLALLTAAVPVQAGDGPAKRLEETHQGHQVGVVYSLSHEDWITFNEDIEICVNLDYHQPWHDASFSILMASIDVVVSVIALIVHTGTVLEVQVVADARGLGGPREEVHTFTANTQGGTGEICLDESHIPKLDGFGPDGTTIAIGAPEAAWTSVGVTLSSSKTFDWTSNTIPQFAGLWDTDHEMRHRDGLAGANVRAGVAQASLLWGTSTTVEPGDRSHVLAGPMAFSVAEGRWSIDGPGTWDASWAVLPGAPAVFALGTLVLFDAPPGTYTFAYDAVSTGAWPGFYAHVLPYDAPPPPPIP